LKSIKYHNNFSLIKTAKYSKDIITNLNPDLIKAFLSFDVFLKIFPGYVQHELLLKERNLFFLLLFQFALQKNHKSNAGKISALLFTPFLTGKVSIQS